MGKINFTLIEEISDVLEAYRTSLERAMGAGIATTHAEHLSALAAEYLPSGSGFDRGTTIDLNGSRADRIVMYTSFHHMDARGGYIGWTDHSVIVTPAFVGVNIRVTGVNRRGTKGYIADAFHDLLTDREDRGHVNPWLKVTKS